MPVQDLSSTDSVILPNASDAQPAEINNPSIENQNVPAVPVGSVVDPDTQLPAGAPQVAVDGQVLPEGAVTPPEDVNARLERLQQQTASNNKLLAAIGVDPMSDMADQLEKGLITPEMVQAHVQNRYTNNAQRPGNVMPDNSVQTPVQAARAALETAREKYNAEAAGGTGISIETNNALFDAQQVLNDANVESLRQQVSADRQGRQVNENVEQVLTVARSAPEYANMTPDLQQAVEELHLATTGMIADAGARRNNMDPRQLTPQQYGYFANQSSTKLEAVANYYRELGRNDVRKGIRPQVQNSNLRMPTPAGTSNLGAPGIPQQKVTLANHRERAKQYMAGNGQV